MFSVWNWASRILLLLALAVLCSILVVVWPDDPHLNSPIELASVAVLLVATISVAVWTVGAWIGEPRWRQVRPQQRSDLKRADGTKGSNATS